MVATLTGVLQIFKKTRESKLLDSLVFLNICTLVYLDSWMRLRSSEMAVSEGMFFFISCFPL